ncbi:MAG: glycoside hydrolase family 18 protein [Bacteroidetes bacterium]|nr:glycoside hydrolase family 18 protein [Bacteroidota bacterium]
MRNSLFFLLLLTTGTSFRDKTGNFSQKEKVVIAYVGGFRGLMNMDSIKAEKITHINYAFVDVKDNRAYLHNKFFDSANMENLKKLKLKNPSLKLLISIGGWSWSGNFSDAVLSDTARKAFAASAVEIVRKFDFDGVDIDWEYPGLMGAGNIYRPEDKENFTFALRDLRSSLNKLASTTGKPKLLTIAAGADTSFISHSDMKGAQKYLDYVNLMTYDFKDEGDPVAGHHTNLYANPNGKETYTDLSVKNFMQAGVPKNKLVVGCAFYGRGWKLKTTAGNGLYQPAIGNTHGGGYTRIKDSLLSNAAYTRFWDADAKAPYLFNARDSIFISYDDEESIKEKCLYIQKNKLAGVMFWEYFEDPKGYLLDVIHRELK